MAVLLDRERVAEDGRAVDLHRVGWHAPTLAAAQLDAFWRSFEATSGTLRPRASCCHPRRPTGRSHAILLPWKRTHPGPRFRLARGATPARPSIAGRRWSARCGWG